MIKSHHFTCLEYYGFKKKGEHSSPLRVYITYRLCRRGVSPPVSGRLGCRPLRSLWFLSGGHGNPPLRGYLFGTKLYNTQTAYGRQHAARLGTMWVWRRSRQPEWGDTFAKGVCASPTDYGLFKHGTSGAPSPTGFVECFRDGKPVPYENI